jgi:hypothetical protein
MACRRHPPRHPAWPHPAVNAVVISPDGTWLAVRAIPFARDHAWCPGKGSYL